ncbi:MAG: nucleotide exchange factor GrpE [Bacilli bacterium]|nr:nucleotide exchange factor GrpE [Bacilli bacterium]
MEEIKKDKHHDEHKHHDKHYDKHCKCGEKCECHEKKEHKHHDKKLNEALEKIKKLEEEVLKAKADNINYRKRKDEEVGRLLEFSNEDIVRDILPSIDNFERAINLDDDNLDDELSKFLTGFKMIYCHLIEVLEKYDVKAIDDVRKPFDPKFHQAVLTEKIDGVEPGIVIDVMQKGYTLKGKVIRPAMVKVSE